nr:hypothetical protein [Tanacetum cinerariifolium]
MIAHLTKSDASKGFKQILDFLNASVIYYALTVNPTIYVSCIKQFWSSVSVKKVNDVIRLQALIDRKKVLITDNTVREALHLDDVESIDCLPNEKIFAELARMVADDVITDVVDHAAAEPTPPSPTPTTTPRQPQEVPSTSQDDEPKPAKLKEVIKVVTTIKLMTEVVTAAVTPITAATITAASSPKSKDKGKEIMVRDPKPLKKQAQIEQDEAYATELEAELNKNINWDDVIEHVKKKGKEDNTILSVAFLEKSKEELEEEASRALERKKVEELKKHLQIVLTDEDDVYIEATPLALKVPVVDYKIHTKNNKPYYKIIKADGTHQLFLSFLSLLRSFDKDDLEILWKIV